MENPLNYIQLDKLLEYCDALQQRGVRAFSLAADGGVTLEFWDANPQQLPVESWIDTSQPVDPASLYDEAFLGNKPTFAKPSK